MGDVFDDRAPSGESRTSIVKVARYPPDPLEQQKFPVRFGSLLPESTARPRKRKLGPSLLSQAAVSGALLSVESVVPPSSPVASEGPEQGRRLPSRREEQRNEDAESIRDDDIDQVFQDLDMDMVVDSVPQVQNSQIRRQSQSESQRDFLDNGFADLTLDRNAYDHPQFFPPETMPVFPYAPEIPDSPPHRNMLPPDLYDNAASPEPQTSTYVTPPSESGLPAMSDPNIQSHPARSLGHDDPPSDAQRILPEHSTDEFIFTSPRVEKVGSPARPKNTEQRRSEPRPKVLPPQVPGKQKERAQHVGLEDVFDPIETDDESFAERQSLHRPKRLRLSKTPEQGRSKRRKDQSAEHSPGRPTSASQQEYHVIGAGSSRVQGAPDTNRSKDRAAKASPLRGPSQKKLLVQSLQSPIPDPLRANSSPQSSSAPRDGETVTQAGSIQQRSGSGHEVGPTPSGVDAMGSSSLPDPRSSPIGMAYKKNGRSGTGELPNGLRAATGSSSTGVSHRTGPDESRDRRGDSSGDAEGHAERSSRIRTSKHDSIDRRAGSAVDHQQNVNADEAGWPETPAQPCLSPRHRKRREAYLTRQGEQAHTAIDGAKYLELARIKAPPLLTKANLSVSNIDPPASTAAPLTAVPSSSASATTTKSGRKRVYRPRTEPERIRRRQREAEKKVKEAENKRKFTALEVETKEKDEKISELEQAMRDLPTSSFGTQSTPNASNRSGAPLSSPPDPTSRGPTERSAMKHSGSRNSVGRSVSFSKSVGNDTELNGAKSQENEQSAPQIGTSTDHAFLENNERNSDEVTRSNGYPRGEKPPRVLKAPKSNLKQSKLEVVSDKKLKGKMPASGTPPVESLTEPIVLSSGPDSPGAALSSDSEHQEDDTTTVVKVGPSSKRKATVCGVTKQARKGSVTSEPSKIDPALVMQLTPKRQKEIESFAPSSQRHMSDNETGSSTSRSAAEPMAGSQSSAGRSQPSDTSNRSVRPTSTASTSGRIDESLEISKSSQTNRTHFKAVLRDQAPSVADIKKQKGAASREAPSTLAPDRAVLPRSKSSFPHQGPEVPPLTSKKDSSDSRAVLGRSTRTAINQRPPLGGLSSTYWSRRRERRQPSPDDEQDPESSLPFGDGEETSTDDSEKPMSAKSLARALARRT